MLLFAKRIFIHKLAQLNTIVIDKITSIQPILFSKAISLTKDKDLAEDLVQDTNLKLLKVNNYDVGLAITIMKNLFYDQHRIKKAKIYYTDSDYTQRLTDEVMDDSYRNILISRMKECISAIEIKEHRRVMWLRCKGYKYIEIVEATGIKMNTVKGIIRNSSIKIREKLTISNNV